MYLGIVYVKCTVMWHFRLLFKEFVCENVVLMYNHIILIAKICIVNILLKMSPVRYNVSTAA